MSYDEGFSPFASGSHIRLLYPAASAGLKLNHYFPGVVAEDMW